LDFVFVTVGLPYGYPLPPCDHTRCSRYPLRRTRHPRLRLRRCYTLRCTPVLHVFVTYWFRDTVDLPAFTPAFTGLFIPVTRLVVTFMPYYVLIHPFCIFVLPRTTCRIRSYTRFVCHTQLHLLHAATAPPATALRGCVPAIGTPRFRYVPRCTTTPALDSAFCFVLPRLPYRDSVRI